MAFAISVKALGETAARITDYWSKFSQFEQAPSMAALDYPPHVTLAVYDGIPEQRVREALAPVFREQHALPLRFRRLNYFESPQLVFWADPAPSKPLFEVHAAIHSLIAPSHCREHYRPGSWVPHCTLATQVSPGNTASAIAFVSEPIKPFDVIFDCADCAEFYPVRVVEEHRLSAAV